MQKQLIIDSNGLIHDVKQQSDFMMWAIDHFATQKKIHLRLQSQFLNQQFK